ncbi:NAD(P)-binding Rossmann-fold containing protein [Glarea lozoyensis ATCC 20868]|uniref:NAD(P)-binding Rossmann-fold containing protein n=1 Tax=Glarea lozoyensis (strain ATCC 20868 / MF5171) TaxID=1116229 RepID=S3DBW4_GLAL2|nr:NAD(P)-binding Rossmann-fold containing protein [Glarea lozoyensis ATCC 20868]EPE35917.1 NAD(P)-binding Rossmann-fold containing protein [Glarea lozoyensis ATCC 20868]
MASFTDADIPDLTGKVIAITGGLTTSRLLASHNATLILLCRDPSKTTTATTTLKQTLPQNHAPISTIPCDLSSLPSVRLAASTLRSQTKQLDILICNAGIMSFTPGLTSSGHEKHMCVNHLGHALLINLLLPLLSASHDPRIISLTSKMAFYYAPSSGIEFEGLKSE